MENDEQSEKELEKDDEQADSSDVSIKDGMNNE